MSGDDSTTPYVGPPSQADPGLERGARLGEYVVQARISQGGHGAVYEAEHRLLGRRAAIKILHRHLSDSEEMVARFAREARVVNQIRHPAIVDIYDLGSTPDGRPYCVMEFLPGRSLSAVLADSGRLEARAAVAILEQVCGALAAAHAAGVVHRDVKASNVMVDGLDPPRVKLLDFGIAKLTGAGAAGLTRAGERLGTQSYMSPEQLSCLPVDGRTDVYAAGVLLFQLLTGRLPYVSADPAEVERLHLQAPPPRPSHLAPVPPAFDAVVARCLAKDPGDRYASADELAAALREAAGASTPGAEQPAVAIHVAFAAPGEDDETLMRQAQVLDACEEFLRARGFGAPLATASAVLAVRPLDAVPDVEVAARSAREAAMAMQLDARASFGDLGGELTIWVHFGTALVEGDAVVGGDACRPEEWALPAPPGIHPTRAAAPASAGAGAGRVGA